MPVYGSYKDNKAFSGVRQKMMCRQTVDESLDKLQEMVRFEIDKFSDTGELWHSVKRTDVKRAPGGVWYGEVYSELEYAAAIEYGMPERFIRPEKKSALKWVEAGAQAFSKGHRVSAFRGHHMFLRAKSTFDRTQAEEIAVENARVYLGALDAGRRTVVI